ncbi:MAG: ribonuclease Z [Geobacter sp.]|nr:ribonuclease Z [Geobacter sp.]
MKPLLLPQLVNDPFGDPAVYVDFLFERRAILFDLGDLSPLSPRKLLRVSHIFVSHAHMDHFIGFDPLVRLLLGREKELHIFGPPGFVDQVAHRLAGYTWNLVESYPTDFTVVAWELHPDDRLVSAEFHCQRGFRRENETERPAPGGLLLDEETLRLRAVILDHRTPSLAFSLEEKVHVNILKNRLIEQGWPVGSWLRDLKLAVQRGAADDLPFNIKWKEEGETRETTLPLGHLKETILTVEPGQKVVYVADSAYHEANAATIVALACDADYLFIEASFPEEDAERARARFHLTALRAGEMAREANVRQVVPFHFSPRYEGREELLRDEVMQAFRG